MDRTKFKNDRNAYITQGLFYETCVPYRKHLAMYTFMHHDIEVDGKKYKSIFKAYLDCGDPTEYDFAVKYFDCWDHWQRICESSGCAEWIAKMRSELSIKLRSEAIKRIISHSEDEKGFQAAKYIADKKWENRGRGRKKKQQEDLDFSEERQISAEVMEDAKTAGIQIN